jgi:hypothetical protein
MLDTTASVVTDTTEHQFSIRWVEKPRYREWLPRTGHRPPNPKPKAQPKPPVKRQGPYIPTQREIDTAISVLQYLPRTKTIRPRADLYTMMKLPCEIISREYISARAMVLAAMELGFKMRFTKPSGHSAAINAPVRAVAELRRRAGLS